MEAILRTPGGGRIGGGGGCRDRDRDRVESIGVQTVLRFDCFQIVVSSILVMGMMMVVNPFVGEMTNNESCYVQTLFIHNTTSIRSDEGRRVRNNIPLVAPITPAKRIDEA